MDLSLRKQPLRMGTKREEIDRDEKIDEELI